MTEEDMRMFALEKAVDIRGIAETTEETIHRATKFYTFLTEGSSA